MLGFIFGILSAASFGLADTSTRRGVLKGTVTQALFVSVTLGVPLFLVAAAISGQLFHANLITSKGYLLLAAAGIVHFIGGRYCNYRTISAIGATRAAPISTVQLPYSVIVAAIFLGERVTPLMTIGILLVMVSPLILFEQRKKERVIAGGSTDAPSAVSADLVPPIRQAEGYFFGILGAIAYGTSPILIKAALENNGLGIYGGFVSYVAAAGVVLVMLAFPGGLRVFQSIEKKAMPWFVITTVMVFFAQMFRFAALAITSVTIVATLQRLSGVFVLIFAFMFNRHLEKFSWRVVAGIFLAVGGAVLLAIGKYL